MFRKSITTITIAAAAFVALGSASPASASGVDCYTAPAHCQKISTELVAVNLKDDVAVIVNDPKVPGPTVELVPADQNDDITLITHDPKVPQKPHGHITDIGRPPVTDSPDDGGVIQIAPPTGHTAGGNGGGTTTTTQPPANDQDNDHKATAGQGSSTNTSAVGQSTDEGSFTKDVAAEAISLADQSTETNSNTTFNPMMAALFGVLASLATMSLAGAAFAAGRRRN